LKTVALKIMVKRFAFYSCLLLICIVSNAQKINVGNNIKAGNYASINGIRLYYETYGTGTPLLLLHGNAGSINAFEKQIPFLAKHFKVIAIDSRLQGRSGGNTDTLSYNMMANDFCSLIKYLQLDSVYVLGWSDGGINGILMALQCTEKVKRLAFTGVNIVPDSTALSAAEINNTKELIAKNKANKLENTLNRLMLYQPNISIKALSAITCPVLVMAGDHDLIKPEHTLMIYQSLPNAQLCIFPDSNHGVCQQHPDLFNKTVLDFFKKPLQ
jgi:pimeloyl-ACP methyl ester carboxylesterase